MTRLFPVLGCIALLAAVLVAQQPSIQNGRVEPRKATTIEREIAAVSSTEPVWVAWRAPIVNGERGGCSYYSDSNSNIYVRGWALDDANRPGAPQITQPTGPVPIEAGTGLVMLVRVVEGKLERFRTLGDDCPIDAGGRTVHWLDGITAAESLRYLDTLTRLDGPSWLPFEARRTVARDALSAIALHRDAGADAILDRVATSATDEFRSHAASLLGRHRAAHGFATLQQLLKTATTSEARRSIVSAIAQSREAGAVEALRVLARDSDEKVRAEAAYRFAVRGGPAVASEVLAIVDGDAVDTVRNRAVSGIAQWPNGEGVPQLITLARSSRQPGVRKQAVSSLSSSRDPRAIAYLESLLK